MTALTPKQMETLCDETKRRARALRCHCSAIFAALRRHFNVRGYKWIAAEQYEEALQFVRTMEVLGARSTSSGTQGRQDTAELEALRARVKELESTLRMLVLELRDSAEAFQYIVEDVEKRFN